MGLIISLNLIFLSLLLIAYAILRLSASLNDIWLWYRDYLRQKEQFKRRIYELQTDLEAERREYSILKLELDLARQKVNPKSGPRTN